MTDRPLLLLVEDSPEIAHIVGYLAKRAGQDLVCRSNVSQAWEYLQDDAARAPDLILLDLNLPGDAGIELYRRIKGRDRPMPPVALFTQWAQTKEIAEVVAEGIDLFVSKELLSRPGEWGPRIDEVLRLAADPPSAPTPEQAARLAPPEQVARAIRNGLAHPALRWVGLEVLEATTRRAVERAAATPGCEPGIDPGALGPIVTGELAPLTRCCHRFLSQLVRSLVYQVECLLGSDAAAPLRTALAAAGEVL